MMHARWIFFDIGWTLVDETEAHLMRLRKTRELLTGFGRAYSVEQLMALCERAATQLAPSPFFGMLGSLGLNDAQLDEVKSSVSYGKSGEKLYPRVAELLASLSSRFKLGVIANQSAGTEERLTSWGLRDHFSLVFASTELGLSKPDPRIFAAASEAAQCTPAEAVMVGDRLDNDIGPAKQQGWRTVRVLQGFSRHQAARTPHENPDITISEIGELAACECWGLDREGDLNAQDPPDCKWAESEDEMGTDYRIAIVGAGNIGIAIASGIADSGMLQADHITLTRRRTDLLSDMAQRGFCIEQDNTEATKAADIVVIAVEPQQVDGLLDEIAGSLDVDRHVVVSIATGVSIGRLRQRLGNDVRIMRAMPNTAIAARQSMTCIATDSPHDEDTAFAFSLFESVGSVMKIPEESMNAATALGACGIAFFLQAIRAASQGGIEIGFSAADALAIAAQTARGAAELLRKTGSHPAQEIDKVTTPRGCTIVGLNQLEHEGFSSALIKGIKASENKAAQLYV